MIKTFYFFLFIFNSLPSLASGKPDRFILSQGQRKPHAPQRFEVDRTRAAQPDLTAQYRRVLEQALLDVKPPEGAHGEINSFPSSHPAKRKIGDVQPPRPLRKTTTAASLVLDALYIRTDSSSLLASLPTGDIFIALGHDLYIHKRTRECINIYTPADEVAWYFTSVIYYHEYGVIAAGTSTGRILIFSSTETFRHLRTLHTPGKVLSMSSNHYNKKLAIASLDPNGSRISFHDLRMTQHQVASWSTENISCLNFDPSSGDTLASAGPSGIVRLWDVRHTDEPKATFNPHKSSPINTIAWNPYKSHRIATGSSQEISVFNELSGKPYAKMTGTEAIRGLIWTRSGLLSAEGNQVHLRRYPDLENISWTCRQDSGVSQIALDQEINSLWTIHPYEEDQKRICHWDNLPIELEPKSKQPDDSQARAQYRSRRLIR